MKKTLLLVEDDELLYPLYEHVFTKAGYRVIIAKDGSEGLLLAQEKPDLILLDIMLPKLNGVDTLTELKKDPITKNIPVIMLSNLGNEEIIKELLEIGASGYLLKSKHDPYEIVRRVKNYLVA